MKYGILVLGASISISLFIRICCSLEANLDQTEDLFLGRAEEVYEKFLKFSLMSGVREQENAEIEKEANTILNEWMQEIKSIKMEASVQKTTTTLAKLNRHDTSITFNDEICGSSDPPDLPLPWCRDPDGCICDPELDLPDGCEMNVLQSSMTCKLIANIPPLPAHLNSLELHETQIANISVGEIQNVTINKIGLYRNAIEHIHPWAFDNVQGLKTLVIVGNKIKYLAYDIFVGLDDALLIDLQNNEISLEIYQQCPIIEPVDDIRTVLPNLRFLTLSGNPLTIIPKQIFAGLRDTELEGLYLDSCYIQEIEEEAFTFLKSLKILNLSNNPAQAFNPLGKFAKILKPLTSLKTIYLADLGFSDIPMEALSQLSHQLEVVDLSKNKFFSIRYDPLSQFPNLKELYLDDSSVQFIESDAFMRNTNLEVLSLKNNKLRQESPLHFPPSLKYLFVTNIVMGSVPLNFHNLSNLFSLEISAVKIERIDSTTLEGLSGLRKVYINRCEIKNIDDGAFQDLTLLDYLDLDDNQISEVRPEMFVGLENLETLSLQNCQLTSLIPISSPPSTTFENASNITPNELSPFRLLPKLKHVHLTGNKITHVSAELFQNLPNLCYVHLDNNPIGSWDQRLFPDRQISVYDDFNPLNDCFFELHLQNVNVKSMTDAMLEDFLSASIIDLSNNVLRCDERTCKLRDLIATSTLTYKQAFVNSDNYTCEHSGNLHRISSLDNETCSKFAIKEDTSVTPAPALQLSSSSAGFKTTLVSVMASFTLLTTVVIILAYKNRAHLRYFWFTFKYNVMPLSPRKAKLSTMEDELSSPYYDYDVFVSYHHEDSKFIEDMFLPEIEMQGERNADEEGVIEAKNFVYLIENDETVKNSNNTVKSSPPRFKVCLHVRDFAAGVPITENIVDCVDRSRKTVIFVSRKYMESQWCSYELNLAYHRLVESRRKSFLLVLLEEVPTAFRSKILNYMMVSKTYLQWPGVNGLDDEKTSFWKRLRAFLQSR